MEAHVTNKFGPKCSEKINAHFAMPFIFTAAGPKSGHLDLECLFLRL